MINDSDKKLFCKYCKGEILPGATVCIHCKKDLRNWFIRHYIISTLLFIFVGIPFLSGVFSGVKNADTKVADGSETSVVNPIVEVKPWSYSETEDKMTSKKIITATNVAKEKLEFNFPYNGGSTATVSLRKKDGVNDVMLLISKGQFNSSINDNYIRVRFDNNEAKKYSYSRSSDNSSDLVFINETEGFIANLKKSKNMIIEAEFFQEGLRQMEFNVEGLNW